MHRGSAVAFELPSNCCGFYLALLPAQHPPVPNATPRFFVLLRFLFPTRRTTGGMSQTHAQTEAPSMAVSKGKSLARDCSAVAPWLPQRAERPLEHEGRCDIFAMMQQQQQQQEHGENLTSWGFRGPVRLGRAERDPLEKRASSRHVGFPWSCVAKAGGTRSLEKRASSHHRGRPDTHQGARQEPNRAP